MSDRAMAFGGRGFPISEAMRKLVKQVENLVATLADLRSRPRPEAQDSLARQLVAELTALEAGTRNLDQSDFWRETCAQIRICAETGDPDFFLRWPPLAATMASGTTPHAVAAYRHLRRSPAWRGVWSPAIRDGNHGHPPPFLLDLATNATAVQHASHLQLFQEKTGHSFLEADCIVELGGGYGSMCRMVRALGFRKRYIIFDQPPILALQRYYLGSHGIQLGPGGGDAGEVVFCRTIREVADCLADGNSERVSLISTWALSEMPLSLRKQAEQIFVSPLCQKVLLSWQAEFGGIDNDEYFAVLTGRLQAWQGWEWLRHGIARRPGHAYAFGLR